ncbi:HAD family hydrolase [Phytoactinopolyspora limicola]|uniref:HAD family hydrolase n=1 Tax=Phytoactinopolyspora limicola TaxID=2715536 RepID=UPI00140D7833|nr:HAD family hydrolase [Phytoactinopolyspora limicola]
MTGGSSLAITFDLDDTLVRNAFSSWVIPEIAEHLGNGDSSVDLRAALFRRHREALDRGDPVAAYNWQAHADALAVEVGVAAGSVDVAATVRRHAVPGKVRLLHEHTVPVLRGLREAGWRVSILTNGFRVYQEPVLRSTGLWDEVDGVVTTDDIGRAKPDRRAFVAALGEATTTVHVGDRIDHDVQGARQAGVTSVLMRPDAPFAAVTLDLDPARAGELDTYLARVADTHGMPVAGRQPATLVPDAVIADIADLPAILDELGKEATTAS